MILKSHRGLPRSWMVIVSVCLIFAGPLPAEVPREKKETAAVSLRKVEADRILDVSVRNLYRVAPGIYRSAQPDREEFRLLSAAGLKSVLNLRAHHSDREKINALPVQLFELPMNAGSLTPRDLFMALVLLRDAPKPVLIHCWHGSDRTGAVVAAWRIVFQKQDVETALKELMDPRYGHHRLLYRNIPDLLRGMDWKRIRESILLPERPEESAFSSDQRIPSSLPAGNPVRR